MPNPVPKVFTFLIRRTQQHDPTQRLEITRFQTLHAVRLTSEIRKR